MQLGGHLASVESGRDTGELYSDIHRLLDPNIHGYFVWLGGRNDEDVSNWTWSNGKKWVYEDWRIYDRYGPEPSGGRNQCLSFNYLDYGKYGTWHDWNCIKIMPFVCQFQPEVLEQGTRSLRYQKGNLPKDPINLWWKSDTVDEKVIESRNCAIGKGVHERHCFWWDGHFRGH